MTVKTNGCSELLAPMFSLGLSRYANSDGAPLWRLQVRHHPLASGPPLLETDATPEMMRSLQQWAKRMETIILSDGNRKPEDTQCWGP